MKEIAIANIPQVMSTAVMVAPSANPMELLDRALTSGASPDVLEKLMALQERWEANQARKGFDEAMANAKSQIPVINKNRTVDFTGTTGKRTNYKHEDMAEIARTVDPILSRHGLSYRYRTSSVPNEPVIVTCIVSHRMGHSEENTLSAGRDDTGNKNSIQAIGSTVTFLQRYTLKAALGLAAAADDDAKATEAPELVNEQQLDQLKIAIVQAGADIAKFCAIFKIETVDELPAKRFDEAMKRLARFAAPKGAA